MTNQNQDSTGRLNVIDVPVSEIMKKITWIMQYL